MLSNTGTYQRILISQVSDNRKDVSLRLALINYAQCLFESCNQVLQNAQKKFKIELAKGPVMTLLSPFALSMMLLKDSLLAESLISSVSTLVETLSKCAMFPSVRHSVREFEIVQARRRLLRHKFLESSNSGFVFGDTSSSLQNIFTRSYVGERDDWSGQLGFEFTALRDVVVHALGRSVRVMFEREFSDHISQIYHCNHSHEFARIF